MDQKIISSLRESYNKNALERNNFNIEKWKAEEREHFLTLLQKESKQHLLEIGAGHGRDGKFFQDQGLDVVCTDLSPEMVALCRAKGLTAHVMDFQSLNFPVNTFDAVYALNCLLHVPKSDLNEVLQTIHALLKSTGLFYLGIYGGNDFEGIWLEDTYSPKRFYSFHTDEQIKKVVAEYFELLYFKTLDTAIKSAHTRRHHHFQSMILKRA